MKKGIMVLLCMMGTGTLVVADLVSPIGTEETPAAGTLLRDFAPNLRE